jgi:hypothetical protein
VWFSTTSENDIRSPGGITDEVHPGDLYIHSVSQSKSKALRRQIWMYGTTGGWASITDRVDQKGFPAVYHPNNNDRVLRIRADGQPSWVTRDTFLTAKGRDDKKRRGVSIS